MHRTLPVSRIALLLLAGCAAMGLVRAAAPVSCVVFDPAQPARALPIVLQHDPQARTGFRYADLAALSPYDATPAGYARSAVAYLREGLTRMTGREVAVTSGADLSRGIVLTTLAGATAEIRNDPAVRAALRDTGADAYNAIEAYYLRSERGRVLVVANTAAGLAAAVVDLLESVGYEVLGMGPNWTHVPEYRRRLLAFALARGGRPGYYLRGLLAFSGQEHGVGTLYGAAAVRDPADEPVETSYRRWMLGARMFTRSMDAFPGHALQAYHAAVIDRMIATGNTEGFLTPKTVLGREAERPAAAAGNTGWLWVNTDAKGQPGAGDVYLSTGEKWQKQNLLEVGVKLDLSSPIVRGIVLERMQAQAEAWFASHPDEPFIFGTESEDGVGYAKIGEYARYPQWYPEYLKAKGVPFGAPYRLHGAFGLDQPTEQWDPASPSDHIFGFNCWLLREFDAWIDAQPAAQRVTSSGRSKKALARCSFYSYGLHDVPPSFNPDPRIRVMIAGFPAHRGLGKWAHIASSLDDARAFQQLLPREPSGIYQILSVAYYNDYGPHAYTGVNSSAASIARSYRAIYQSGVKAITAECDFNFGKFGLYYYLISKMLWNPTLTDAQLETLRDRWFTRAFGSGWREMKAAYDAIMPQNFPIAGAGTCGQIAHLIEQADRKVDPAREADAQRRIDDVKQYWYFYYLLNTGKGSPDAREFREFVWKGQMSYMTAMHMVTRRYFSSYRADEAAGPEFNRGPAHFTPEETARWWGQLLRDWPRPEVIRFRETALRNGVPGSAVDLNDMVRVAEFAAAPGSGYYYNAGAQTPPVFLTLAGRTGEEIGFTQFWPYSDASVHQGVLDVSYGVERWDSAGTRWEALVDVTTARVRSQAKTLGVDRSCQAVEVRYRAPRPGIYRFTVTGGGYLSQLTGLDVDWQTGAGRARQGVTYAQPMAGLTQSPTWFYIPKGTKRLDLEVWDPHDNKKLTLYRTLPSAKTATVSRVVDIGARTIHRIPLQAGEDGTVAMIAGNGFAFPVLYSVPMLWAKTPAELLVPRGVALADGLTIIK